MDVDFMLSDSIEVSERTKDCTADLSSNVGYSTQVDDV